jgi:hypothetical protein
MITTKNYYYYKNALDTATCEKIIGLGISKLTELKNSGVSTEASTSGYNHKQFMEKIEKNLEPMNDLSVEDIKKLKNISAKDIENKTYIRDSEVSWLSDQWLYDLILPYVENASSPV